MHLFFAVSCAIFLVCCFGCCLFDGVGTVTRHWRYIRNITSETSIAKRHFRNVTFETQVEAESAAVGHLEQKQFVGSMAFNRFMQASASPTTTSPTVPTDTNNDSSSSSSSGDEEEQEHASIDDGYEPGVYYTDDDEDGYIVDDDSSDYVPGGGGVFEEAKEVALNVLRRDSIVGSMAQSFVADAEGDRRHGGGQMERSATTVTATTDVSRTPSTSV